MDCVAYLAADFQLTRDVQTQTFWRLRPSAHCGDEQNFEWASISLNTWWVQENKKYNSSKNRDLQIWTDLFFLLLQSTRLTDRQTDRQTAFSCLSVATFIVFTWNSRLTRGVFVRVHICDIYISLCSPLFAYLYTICHYYTGRRRLRSSNVATCARFYEFAQVWAFDTCCVYGTTLTPRTSEFRRLPKTHLCAEDHSHYVLLILFIYLIYQSTAWQSKNNKHQINAIPGLNGQCRDSSLKHGQHKG